MEKGMVGKESDKLAEPIDFMAYREQKLQRERLHQIHLQEKMAEHITREESRRRYENRLLSSTAMGMAKKVRRRLQPLQRASLMLITASLITLLLFAVSMGFPAIAGIFTASALLIPLVGERERLGAFLVFVLVSVVAWLYLPAAEVRSMYMCFGAYALFREFINKCFSSKASGVFRVLLLFGLASAMLIPKVFADGQLLNQNAPLGMPDLLYIMCCAVLLAGSLIILDKLFGMLHVLYNKKVHPFLHDFIIGFKG